MSKRIPAMLLAVTAVLAAPSVRAADVTGSSFTIEGYGGWRSLNVNSATSAVASTSESNAIIGGDLLFKGGLFGIGLALDKGLSGSVEPWHGSALLGLVFDLLPSLRLEALGEIGRRGAEFGDMFNSNGQTFVGVRPGVSFRLLPSPVRLGVAVPVRWMVSGTSTSDFSSPDWGIIGKVGLEFP